MYIGQYMEKDLENRVHVDVDVINSDLDLQREDTEKDKSFKFR